MDNGIGGSITVDYTYENAKIHRGGKGFLGFNKVTATNNTSQIETINWYNYYIYNAGTYYYITTPSESEIKTTGGSVFLKSLYNYSLIDYGNKRIFPYISDETSTDYLQSITVEKVNAFDNNNNINSETVSYKENGNEIAETETIYSNYIDAITVPGDLNTIPNKPQNVSVSMTRTGKTAYVRNIDYEYYTNGNVYRQINDPSKPKQVTNQFEYYTTGNLKKSTLIASGLSSRFVSYEYDNKYRFITKVTDALGQFTTNSYDPATGNVLSSTDLIGKITTYNYNRFGRLTETTLPTGKKIINSFDWYTGSEISNAVYFIKTSPEGMQETTRYFDLLGRELRIAEQGYNNQNIYTDTEYNSKGLVSKVSDPYFSFKTPKWTVYAYDGYGRITTEIYDGGTIFNVYNYTGRTTKITNTATNPQQFTEKTIDATGSVKKITDKGGSIYYYYHSSNQPRLIVPPGAAPHCFIEITYDDYGRQDTLDDPGAGLVTYSYNAFGELESQTDARGNEYAFNYDVLGRIISRTGPEGLTSYAYYTTGNEKGQIQSISGPGSMSKSFSYDQFGRNSQITDNIESGVSLTTSYGYDDFGRLQSYGYPSGFNLTYSYDQYGFLNEIFSSNYFTRVWKTEYLDPSGRPTQYILGYYKIRVFKEYDDYRFIQRIKSYRLSNSEYIQDMEYSFNDSTGNLNWRKDHIHQLGGNPLYESFTYDCLNRLVTSTVNGTQILDMQYDNLNGGNIQYKSDAGNYGYGYTRPHAVTEITDPTSYVGTEDPNITYTPFNKVESILQGDKYAMFDYGPEQTLKKLTYYEGEPLSLEYERFYTNNYEKLVLEDGTEKEYHYIHSPDGLVAVYIIVNGSSTSGYLVLKDHLGSIAALADNSGQVVEEYSFDPWGRRRDPDDWREYDGLPSGFILVHGFTGHEHMDNFGLINMTGREYDPVLGRFLSPDNYVQWPDYTQSFNRYGYCLNNPLVYTDPDGEFIFTALLAPIGLAPLGVIIDAACWSAAIDAGIQGVRIATGNQDKFNWAELGGAAVGGAVFAGMALVAPSFSVTSTSFITNLPKYAGKAGYAALTGAVSTGAGMFASDMFDNGQIDYSGVDYLKAMGTAGLISGGFSFANSIYDYATWDRLSTTDKILKLQNKFGSNLQYDPTTGDYGYFSPIKSTTNAYIGPSALNDRGIAYYTARHELKHVSDWSKYTTGKLKIPAHRGLVNHFEIRAHKLGMRNPRISYNYWLDRYDLIRGRGAYAGYGYGYKGFVFSFGLDQLWNFFY